MKYEISVDVRNMDEYAQALAEFEQSLQKVFNTLQSDTAGLQTSMPECDRYRDICKHINYVTKKLDEEMFNLQKMKADVLRRAQCIRNFEQRKPPFSRTRR